MYQCRKDVLAGPFPKDTGSNLPCDTNAAIFVFVSIPFYQVFFHFNNPPQCFSCYHF